MRYFKKVMVDYNRTRLFKVGVSVNGHGKGYYPNVFRTNWLLDESEIRRGINRIEIKYHPHPTTSEYPDYPDPIIRVVVKGYPESYTDLPTELFRFELNTTQLHPKARGKHVGTFALIGPSTKHLGRSKPGSE